jgi:hypothetical protein
MFARLSAPSLLFALALPITAQANMPDQVVLETILKKKALVIADENVMHFYAWRRGVTVEWHARPAEIFEGISLRASFQKHGDECILAGQFALLQAECAPVLEALAGGNLRIASLVPRFPGSTPEIFDLRFFGEGTEEELAKPLAAGLAAVLVPTRTAAPTDASAPQLGIAPGISPAERSAAGPSTIQERPLEDIFGRKAEVKNGVALFRIEGAKGLMGGTPTSRMNLAIFASFAGSDEAARVRLDWSIERRHLVRLVQVLVPQGFVLESIVAAAPGLDDEMLQVVLVGSGRATDLARCIAGELEHAKKQGAMLMAQSAFTPPQGVPEVLGIGTKELANGFRSGATHPDGNRRAVWQLRPGNEPIAVMTDPGQWSGSTFNLLWTPDIKFRDGKLTLRMRADQGRIDQGGGLIWRAKDENNYYVTRFNPLEQDFRVYHVKDGVRTQIKALGQLPYRSQDWYTIEVTTRGDEIRCVLNGREELVVQDESFPDAGGIGIWSKADSQCSLAGLYVEPFAR